MKIYKLKNRVHYVWARKDEEPWKTFHIRLACLSEIYFRLLDIPFHNLLFKRKIQRIKNLINDMERIRFYRNLNEELKAYDIRRK